MKYIIFVFTIILLVQCGNSTETNPSNSQATSNSEKIELKKHPKTEPSLSAVYEHFDSIAPIFEYQNDTVYVINFWATWCVPCIEELPYFEYLNKEYQDHPLKVILVSLDSKKHIESKLKPFIQKEKLMSEVVVLTDIDYNSWIDKVNPEWDGAIPATIVYDAEAYQFIAGQFDSYDDLHSIIKSFIKS